MKEERFFTTNVKQGKDFLLSRVVTRHFVSDFFQSIRNIFGLRLRSYEFVIKLNYNEMLKEMRILYKNNVKWYRSSFNPLGRDSIMINLYGELK
jgi:hypothetical protein